MGSYLKWRNKREQQAKAAAEQEFRDAVEGLSYTATDKQMRFLLNLGAERKDLEGISKRKASQLIDRLLKETGS